MRGDEVFGHRITISYFREQTEEEAEREKRYAEAEKEAKERELARLQAELGVVCYAAPGKRGTLQDRRLSASGRAKIQRQAVHAIAQARSASVHRRRRGRNARRSARTALRCAPSVGCGRPRSRPACGSGFQKLGQPVPLSNLVAELNSGSAQPAQTKMPLRCSFSSGLVNARSVPASRRIAIALGSEHPAPFGGRAIDGEARARRSRRVAARTTASRLPAAPAIPRKVRRSFMPGYSDVTETG